MRWIQAARARLHLLFARRANEQRMDEEFRFHIEMETKRHIRESGVAPDEARRLALVAFGGVEKHREDVRDGLGLKWLSGLSLDLKLGFRMLIKYPGLTVVGCLALSVAIGASAAYLEVLNDGFHSTLPVEGGERIVLVRNWDVAKRQREMHILQDYSFWRTQVKTVQDMGAFQAMERNLIPGGGSITVVKGAELTASAFRLMQTRALLGRTLQDADELPTSNAVMVLGHRVWQMQFGGDDKVIGRNVQWGNTSYTIVGVMPEGFSFPATEQLWVPLRATVHEFARGSGPALNVVGRLAPGAEIGAAQAEFTALGVRTAADYPETNRNVRPLVKPYLDWLSATSDEDRALMLVAYWGNLFFVALLLVCGANVATLVFARTATREAELTVRTALGASRGRLIAQLFAEAIVLTSLAAVLGLVVAYFGMRQGISGILDVAGGVLPFWWDASLSGTTLIYTVMLTVLAAVVVGVIPARKATAGHLQARLRNATVGTSGMKFGSFWTVIIATQVGLTVFFLFIVVSIGWNVRMGRLMPAALTVPAAEFVTASVGTEETKLPDGAIQPLSPEMRAAYDRSFLEFKRQLLAEPGVTAVTYTSRLPGAEMRRLAVEVDEVARTAQAPRAVRTVSVSPDFFAAISASIISGRLFTAADTLESHPVAIVDQTFARHVFGNRPAVGQRVRRAARAEHDEAGAWVEIVGVVADLTKVPEKLGEDGLLYQPTSPSDAYPARIVLHTRAQPQLLYQRLSVVAAQVEPGMRVSEVALLSEGDRGFNLAFVYVSRILVVVGAVALILSAAGVYSLMTFTVARRTREIGIRVALGADAGRVVRAILLPALKQVSIGVLLGSVPGTLLVAAGAEGLRGGGAVFGAFAFLAVAAFILCVGIAACLVPVRRALRVQPTDALSSSY